MPLAERVSQENIYRNFGMPQPNGYRKALRFMRHADKFGFPIITFVDTPGAYAGKNAEELGQARTPHHSLVYKPLFSAAARCMHCDDSYMWPSLWAGTVRGQGWTRWLPLTLRVQP